MTQILNQISVNPAEAHSKGPVAIYCPYDFKDKIPHSISVTLNRCDKANNLIKILNNELEESKKDFVVCAKPLNLDSKITPTRFVEWIEALKILGANTLYIYNRHLPRELFEIAQYYEEEGFMVLEQYLETSGSIDDGDGSTNDYPIFNDCFFKTRNRFKYVVAIDFGEILIPTRDSDKTWGDLVRNSGSNEAVDAFALHRVKFSANDRKSVEGLSQDLYMLQHIQVRKNLYSLSKRCFHIQPF
jgi:hypothetical protein